MISTVIDVSDLPPLYGIEYPARYRANCAQTNVPLRGCALAPVAARHRAYVIDCSLYHATWYCNVCCRISGWFLGTLMCPFGGGA